MSREEFEKAIHATEGPCIIVASQEKGKEFLVARVAHLLGEGVAPEEILILTSSALEAEVLKNDFKKTGGGERILRRIRDFHALSEELVKRHANLLGVTEDVRTLAPDKIILYAQRLLGTDPLLRNHYGKQARYIMASDFNVLNASELAIIDLLGAAWRNICVVGQSRPVHTLFETRVDCFQTFRAQYVNVSEIRL